MSVVAPRRSKQDVLPSGDDAGTAPEDRSFRPDVEGLRAVAILLVVLYHAGVAAFSGGYVGVDVFFVISGFVITGVLLRERASTRSTSILRFYGRRCRRIIPAATLVIVVTVVLSYVFLGIVGGNQTATDGIWATIFLANFHFASTGTNYLTEFQPPSPLLNFWSLSVEEQFYVVYPTLFLLVGKARLVASFRARLVVVLSVVIALSYLLSVLQTRTDPTLAYFSPFTRAWELALGALIAVGAPWLLRVPRQLAMAMTWIGLGLIALATVSFNNQTPYPGSAVALPVLGTGLVLAGGTLVSRYGAESLLRVWPFRQLGKLSYSLYLWHWPILILAAESAGVATLPVAKNLKWLLVALGLSIVTYVAVENPIRHSRPLSRNRLLSVGLGLALIAVTLVIVGGELRAHTATYVPEAASLRSMRDAPSLESVESLVRSAPSLHTVPQNLDPPLGTLALGFPYDNSCFADMPQTSVPPCLWGDPGGARTMVVVGDSHAEMWFYALDAIAKEYHWKMWFLAKDACPDPLLPYISTLDGTTYTACTTWHTFVINRIKQLDPDLVIVSEENRYDPNGNTYSDAVWTDGLAAFFHAIATPKSKFIVIGNIPMLPQTGPDCIARHTDDLQACAASLAASQTPHHRAEAAAVESYGGRYIDPTPWFCSKLCTPVIGNYDVYFDHWHMMGPYGLHLAGVLAQSLQLPRSTDTSWRVPTEIIAPKQRAVLSGTVPLDTLAGSSTGEQVVFMLSGNGHHDTVVATGRLTLDGWLAKWNTTLVPNGSYTLRSLARVSGGGLGVSKPVRIRVTNQGQ